MDKNLNQVQRFLYNNQLKKLMVIKDTSYDYGSLLTRIMVNEASDLENL